MFRIKICGITTVDDAQAVAQAGADAVGLNFFGKSRRFVEPAQARRIVEALPPEVVKVGLFVNASQDEVCGTFDSVGLDLVQLHGDEPPDFLARLGGRPILKAFRLGQEDIYYGAGQLDLDTVRRYLDACRERACVPRLVLVDAHVPGAYGGTGRLADWDALESEKQARAQEAFPPLVLAGGLTADNVAEAIQRVRPHAVDTAGGVESAPGHKDAALVERFVRSARAAFEGLG